LGCIMRPCRDGRRRLLLSRRARWLVRTGDPGAGGVDTARAHRRGRDLPAGRGGGQVVGFGSICPAESGLRSLYVDPRAGRRGVGSRLLVALERMAAAHGARVLVLDASLNAAGFYARRGFEVIGQGTHRLRSARRWPASGCASLFPIQTPAEVLPPSL
jgi:GNAT superfamily N-acetyltransferase